MHPLAGRKQCREHVEKRIAKLKGRKRAQDAGGGRAPNTKERILSLVEVRDPDECWPWKGAMGDKGYGRFQRLGKTYYAHRVVFAITYPGSISWEGDGETSVCHRCDNPPCCNPSHLFLGSHAENMADKVAKGRQPRFTSTSSPRAKLTAEDVSWMRIQKKYGATKKALASLYDVSEATVSGALYGRHYKDV